MLKHFCREVEKVLSIIKLSSLNEKTLKLIAADEFFSKSPGTYEKFISSMEKIVSGKKNIPEKLSKEEKFDIIYGLGFFVQFSVDDKTSIDENNQQVSSFDVLISFRDSLKEALEFGLI